MSDMVERVARALAGPRADELVLAGNPIGEPCEYPRWMLHQLDARAAIRVIAPAVLEEAAGAAMRAVLAASLSKAVWDDISALKTRYEQ